MGRVYRSSTVILQRKTNREKKKRSYYHASTKNKDKKRDQEMISTKKGNIWHFGMKAHIGVDSQSGNIHSLETTTASVHDRAKFKELLHGKEQVIYGDKIKDITVMKIKKNIESKAYTLEY